MSQYQFLLWWQNNFSKKFTRRVHLFWRTCPVHNICIILSVRPFAFLIKAWPYIKYYYKKNVIINGKIILCASILHNSKVGNQIMFIHAWAKKFHICFFNWEKLAHAWEDTLYISILFFYMHIILIWKKKKKKKNRKRLALLLEVFN